jgi:hypothetical protein
MAEMLGHKRRTTLKIKNYLTRAYVTAIGGENDGGECKKITVP